MAVEGRRRNGYGEEDVRSVPEHLDSRGRDVRILRTKLMVRESGTPERKDGVRRFEGKQVRIVLKARAKAIARVQRSLLLNTARKKDGGERGMGLGELCLNGSRTVQTVREEGGG